MKIKILKTISVIIFIIIILIFQNTKATVPGVCYGDTMCDHSLQMEWKLNISCISELCFGNHKDNDRNCARCLYIYR